MKKGDRDRSKMMRVPCGGEIYVCVVESCGGPNTITSLHWLVIDCLGFCFGQAGTVFLLGTLQRCPAANLIKTFVFAVLAASL